MTAKGKLQNKIIEDLDTGKLAAIDENFAVIEFLPDGTIVTANDNFCAGLGYALDEIQNQHHRMFCPKEISESLEYKQFWAKLAEGEAQIGEFHRVTKSGDDLWIHASYSPIKDAKGEVYKVIKFAQDITERKTIQADQAGKINAISRAQAVIEFHPDGTIITANENFLATVGYSLEEIQGQHHRIFCEPEYANSPEYASFWAKLNQGDFDSGEYKRIGKTGNEIWIQASYNPIRDLNGKVVKVVKYATDLTKEKEAYNNLVDTFQSAVIEVSNSSQLLSTTAAQLSGNTESTMQKSQEASAASEQSYFGGGSKCFC